LDEAITAYRQAMVLRPPFSKAHSNLLLALNYHSSLDPSAVYDEHLRWNREHAEPLQSFIQAHANDRSPERRLRIGYVSPDFYGHPVGHFLLPLLAQHDHERFEIFCDAQVSAPDGLTERLRAHADHWHSLIGISDAQAADFIRQHQIDVLVDLSGHTSDNRLLLFAHKPAPVQVTFLGYPNTTGLGTMDYRLTDNYADPPGLTESWHSERLFRLPQCAWCYQSAASPPVGPRKEGPITFGCFNHFAKVTEPMLRLWSRILHLVPGSRLLLKTRALGSESTRQRVRHVLGEAGIGVERLELRGYERAHNDHLALYQRLDVALDTFPYHGTTTTCEALWMGVPVVTLASQVHASRVGVSLLNNIGLPELIADTSEEYVRRAAELAGDLPRLSHLRSTLRQRMEKSPLMDAPRFARDIEAAYRAMWRQWCAKVKGQ
jgi:predicted O-linked N-acetylglucosamine transferase (SPINDLY family)